MSQPRLFYGLSGGNSIVQAGIGRTDAGTPFRVLFRSDAIAPGGAGMDCVFHAAFLALTWTMPATVRVTPILDDVELAAEVVEFSLPAAEQLRSQVFEIGLSQGHARGGLERMRSAMRGTWFAVKVEVAEVLDGRLIAEAVEIDFDVLGESKDPAQPGGGAA